MKVKIVFFDCDGVLMFGNPWISLNKAMGVPFELDRQWFDDYYSGKLSFEGWNKNLENFYKKQKLSKDGARKILDIKNFKFNPEAEELLKYIRGEGIEIAIISSGIDIYIQQVAKHLGIYRWSANASFLFDKNGLFLKTNYIAEDPDAKVITINEICNALKTSPQESIFIGDSYNDVKAFQHTKHGILYKTNDLSLEKFAWKKVKNLKEVINILEEYE